MRPLFRSLLLSLIAVAISVPAQAAITYSGLQLIWVTNDFEGIYIDFTDPLDASSFTTTVSATEPANWDLNPFFGGSAFGNSDTFEVVTDTGATNSTLRNFAAGVTIGDGLDENFVTGASGSTDHMGGITPEFTNGVEGYIAFRVDDGASGFFYGWMSVTL